MTPRLKDEATRARLNEYLPEVQPSAVVIVFPPECRRASTELANKKLTPPLKRRRRAARCRTTKTGRHHVFLYSFYSAVTIGDRFFRLEIDALLNGDSDTKDEPTPGIASDSDIRPTIPIPSVASCVNACRRWRLLTSVSHAVPDGIMLNPRRAAARILPWVPYAFSRINEFARNSAGTDQPEPDPPGALRGTGLVSSPSLPVFIAADNLLPAATVVFFDQSRGPRSLPIRTACHQPYAELALKAIATHGKPLIRWKWSMRSEMQVKFTNITTCRTISSSIRRFMWRSAI